VYILFINFTKTLQDIQPVFPAHLEFIDAHIKTGKFILSGGLTGKPAGVVLANVNNGDELQALLAEDPFVREQVAEYEVIEFKPSKCHESLASLIGPST
jgi:uncharacterized protein YciI